MYRYFFFLFLLSANAHSQQIDKLFNKIENIKLGSHLTNAHGKFILDSTFKNTSDSLIFSFYNYRFTNDSNTLFGKKIEKFLIKTDSKDTTLEFQFYFLFDSVLIKDIYTELGPPKSEINLGDNNVFPNFVIWKKRLISIILQCGRVENTIADTKADIIILSFRANSNK